MLILLSMDYVALIGTVTLIHILAEISPWKAVRIGFLTNVLNPKATIFFLSLFTKTFGALLVGLGLKIALSHE